MRNEVSAADGWWATITARTVESCQSNHCSRQLLIRPHLHQEANCTRRPDWSPNRPHFAVTTCTAPPSRSYAIRNTEHTSLYSRRNSEIRITVFTDVMPCGLVDTNVSEIPFSLQGTVWKQQVSPKHLYLTNYTILRHVFEELKSQTWQISYTAGYRMNTKHNVPVKSFLLPTTT